LLKFLIIFLGVLMAVTRGYGLFFPTKMKELVTKLVACPPLMRSLGIMMLVLAVLIFIALRPEALPLKAVMAFFGVSLSFGAFVLMFWSEKYAALVDWFMRLPYPTLRVLYGIGFALGLLLIVLGIYH
jgi:hypothetical protein